MHKNHRAFTLIELLVVIGIIGILVSGVGLLLKGNNPGAALRGAQSTLMSTLSVARGQAALNQANTMILVQAYSNSTGADNFLRSIRVVVENPAGSNTWKEVGGEVVLPQGIYVVPSSATLTSTGGSPNVTATAGNTDARYLSNFFGLTPGSVNGITGTSFLKSVVVTPLGSTQGGGRILVAAGNRTSASALALDNAAAVRGFIVSNYGVAALVNEADTLGKQ